MLRNCSRGDTSIGAMELWAAVFQRHAIKASEELLEPLSHKKN
jgi:hypothetical protein